MSRSFYAIDLVTLPRLSTPAAIALGADVLAKARAWQASLSPPVARALARLTRSFDDLHESAEAAQGERDFDPARAFDTDLRVDAAWGGFQWFLQGWARMPFEGEEAQKSSAARRLLDVVYPDGLRFTQLSYKIEWAESDVRLARLAQPENAALVALLGAEPFVTTIGQAHVAYGEALGLTTGRVERKARVSTRERLSQFADALRTYAMVVAAHAADSQDDPEAQALAEALLAPIVQWRSPGGPRKVKVPVEPAPGPNDEPASDNGAGGSGNDEAGGSAGSSGGEAA